VDITEIVWRPEVERKIWQKHHVTTEDIEGMFDGDPVITFVERGRLQGEDLYAAWGQTPGGRYLIAFFIHKLSGEALVVSARDMDQKERKRHARMRS